MAVDILAQWGGKLDCQTCNETLREERGHDKEGIVPFMVNGERVFRCPLMLVTPLSWEYIKAFDLYERGYLPNGVGWANESNKFNDAIAILSSAFSKEKNRINKKGK